jgi:Recombinase
MVRAWAIDAYADLAPAIASMRTEGLSLRQIAERLDNEGHTTRKGKLWNQVQAKRLLALSVNLI